VQHIAANDWVSDAGETLIPWYWNLIRRSPSTLASFSTA
jgi:hypothetical protein